MINNELVWPLDLPVWLLICPPPPPPTPQTRERATDRDEGKQSTTVLGKGQIREATAELWVIWQRAGVAASWAQPWEKVGIPREKAAGRERLMELQQERELRLLGTEPQTSYQDAACPPPHPASGQGLLGIFPPIMFPSPSASTRELMEGRAGDGRMLKLVGG